MAHPGGRPKGSTGAQHKHWFLTYLIETLKNDPEQLKLDIEKLRKEDFGKLLEILCKLLPKEQKVDMTVNPFEGKTAEELKFYINNGKWPEE